jgi:SpoVK/Ycf46/Vps4 family AAA+-type ATPase
MDDVTLRSLEAALTASPDNAALRLVVARERHQRGDAHGAAGLLDGCKPADFANADDARGVARILVDGGSAERALAWLDGDAPETLVLKARALVALGRSDEARKAYERAIAQNPTLEDPTLRDTLKARQPAIESGPQDGRPRFMVLEGGDRAEDPALARLLVPEHKRITFADVGGLDAIKEQIRKRIILPFQKPSLFQRFKKKSGGGILLYGAPGCGKTLLARATAGECKATFFNVAISDVLDMYIGESEAKLHALFEKARASRPSVLFFDEIEALGGKRQYSRDSNTGKLVSQFLAEMDGFSQGNEGVLVLGATNVPWAVDAAFRRPGRFDRTFFVPPPDRPAREQILRLHLQERPHDAGVDLAFIGGHTSGYSGADLFGLIEEAADAAIAESLEKGREVAIGDRHLKAALKEAKPTTTEWLTTARNHARYANEGGQYDDVLAFLDAWEKR